MAPFNGTGAPFDDPTSRRGHDDADLDQLPVSDRVVPRIEDSGVEYAPGSPGGGPRALVISTGYIFQVAGLILMAPSGITLLFGGVFGRGLSAPVARWVDRFSGAQADEAVRVALALIGLIGGIAMSAAGIGLQGERAGSGRLGMIVALAVTWSGGAVTIRSLVARQAWVEGACGGLLAILGVVLFLLAGASHATLRRHPPPEDANGVTPEQLEEIRRERDRRRREMGY